MLKARLFITLLAIGYASSDILETAYPDDYDEEVSYVVDRTIATLNQKSFNKTVHCSKDISVCTSYIVMFYNSNSAVSQNFSRTYIVMSVLTVQWMKVVKFGAIDCADSDNNVVCKAHGFKRMPLFQYFDRKSTAGDIGTTIPSYRNGLSLLEALVKQINREYEANLYSDWPKFTPLPEFESSNEVWEYAEGHSEIMLIFVENVNDAVGMELFISAHEAAQGLPVRRVLKGHYLDLLSENYKYPATSTMVKNGRLGCSDPDSIKKGSIFEGTIDRMQLIPKPGNHQEAIEVKENSILYACTNSTDAYRYKRNVDVKSKTMNSAIENKEMILEFEGKHPQKSMTPSFISLKEKLVANP